MRTPDIILTSEELELFSQIPFGSRESNEIHASIVTVVDLCKLLKLRGAVPEVRRLYFTDPERNPVGRGKSVQEMFERNGTFGNNIFAHPDFLEYLEYFICGPSLPAGVITAFRDASRISGYLSMGDVFDLHSKARDAVRYLHLDPPKAAEEFHKLVLECGADPASAKSIREVVRSLRLSK